MFEAQIKESVIVALETLDKPLSVALTRASKKIIYALEKDISKTIRDNFYYPEDPSRVSSIWLARTGSKISSAQLRYKHKAISLSRYKVEQVRITTKKRKLSVKRKGTAWKRRILPDTTEEQIATYVQVRKAGGMHLVLDKKTHLVEGQRLKGFLHTGRKKGETGFDGQTNLFSSKIFVRNQKATWAGKQRLPIHMLFGPSVINLLNTPELQNLIANGHYLDKLENLFSQEFKL